MSACDFLDTTVVTIGTVAKRRLPISDKFNIGAKEVDIIIPAIVAAAKPPISRLNCNFCCLSNKGSVGKILNEASGAIFDKLNFGILNKGVILGAQLLARGKGRLLTISLGSYKVTPISNGIVVLGANDAISIGALFITAFIVGASPTPNVPSIAVVLKGLRQLLINKSFVNFQLLLISNLNIAPVSLNFSKKFILLRGLFIKLKNPCFCVLFKANFVWASHTLSCASYNLAFSGVI